MSSSSSSSSDAAEPVELPETTVSPPLESAGKAVSTIESLPQIIPTINAHVHSLISSSSNPAFSLLHDAQISSHISSLLRQPESGAGDNPLCSWLYDTFQTGDPTLQLIVLRFLPIIAGLYLSRVAQGKTCLGFEVILLTLHAHEANSRGGQSLTVNVPDLSHPSIYHDMNVPTRTSNATELNLAVVSPSLEPCGAVRSTRRSRIVGVALELYYNKIGQIPVGSKIEFCEFCRVWADQDGEINNNNDNSDDKMKEGRILLPWELLQPMLRILGHCLLGCGNNKELFEAAFAACTSLHARALHDINSKAILATRSLIRLGKMSLESKNDDESRDHTEIPLTNQINI